MPTLRTVDDLLGRLKSVTQRDAGQWQARCPAHADSNPSLSVAVGDGKVLLHCHAGCEFEDICKALGTTSKQLNKIVVDRSEDAKSSIQPEVVFNNGVLADTLDLMKVKDASDGWVEEVVARVEGLTDERLNELATTLSVSSDSLKRMHVGWSDDRECWTFPEFNGKAHVVGISCRYDDGSKLMYEGSKRGLYLPKQWFVDCETLLIVEGASDTAAALTEGMHAIGRPSARGGISELETLLRPLPAYCSIVVMGEMDPKADGSWPGKQGAIATAESLSEALGRPVAWKLPGDGQKDLRCWIAFAKDNYVFPDAE
ncbi:MAG: hypothetical protein C0483_09010 [Pirellula sp.]|nr:hypothetical protein [Pirellula sp.]